MLKLELRKYRVIDSIETEDSQQKKLKFSGWLEGFKNRYGIVYKHVSREAAAAKV